ncbi:hypothetical protein VWY34_00200 [Phaeobacter sp. JH20_02]|uniref:hypothetical protein n=1 Tax=unclassified Phaeobacter TaxID=2621772 RepID=UPI003A86D46F
MLKFVFSVSMLASAPLIAICAGLPLVAMIDELPAALFATLPDDHPLPELDVTASYTPVDGWHLKIEVENFVFTDLCISEAKALARGHAHVHLGAEKIVTAYQPHIVIGHLPSGTHEITVSLRAQDHRVLGRPGGGMFVKTLLIKAP